MKTRISSAILKRLDALSKNNSCASIMAFIEPVYKNPTDTVPLEWEASIRLWDGKPKSGGKTLTSRHATMDEAVNAAHAVIENNPCKHANIFIDDLMQ